MIRSLVLSAAVCALATGAAFAADLPSTKGEPAYAPPPPPPFSWTGFYIGANAGVSGLSSTQTTGYYGYGDYYTQDGSGWGFSGGGQIGYNYEFVGTNIVAGVEADFQGSTAQSTYYSSDWSADYSYPYWWKAKTNLNWWGTARVRLGYAFGNVLPYVTGGFAYGRATDTYAYADDTSYESYSFSSTRTGWTAGAGVEYAITNNLTLKIEGLYTALGNNTVNNFYSDSDGSFGSDSGYYTRTNIKFATVRAGLNWKFGDWFAPPAPVVAKY